MKKFAGRISEFASIQICFGFRISRFGFSASVFQQYSQALTRSGQQQFIRFRGAVERELVRDERRDLHLARAQELYEFLEVASLGPAHVTQRSEERRVGKECRSRWS